MALDDILSDHWISVLTGLYRRVAAGGTLVLFVPVPNKLLPINPMGLGRSGQIPAAAPVPTAPVRTRLVFLGEISMFTRIIQTVTAKIIRSCRGSAGCGSMFRTCVVHVMN